MHFIWARDETPKTSLVKVHAQKTWVSLYCENLSSRNTSCAEGTTSLMSDTECRSNRDKAKALAALHANIALHRRVHAAAIRPLRMEGSDSARIRQSGDEQQSPRSIDLQSQPSGPDLLHHRVRTWSSPFGNVPLPTQRHRCWPPCFSQTHRAATGKRGYQWPTVPRARVRAHVSGSLWITQLRLKQIEPKSHKDMVTSKGISVQLYILVQKLVPTLHVIKISATIAAMDTERCQNSCYLTEGHVSFE